jgi:hypothetical protein
LEYDLPTPDISATTFAYPVGHGEFIRPLQHRSDLRCCACSEKGLIEKPAQFWVLMAQGSTLTLCAL